MENTVRLKADREEKSVLAGSEFHTVKILYGKHFCRILQEFCDMYCIVCKRDLWYLCCCWTESNQKTLTMLTRKRFCNRK